MRFLILSAALALAACATAPAPATPSPSAPAGPSDDRSAALVGVLRAAGGASAPTQAQVERSFGAADIVRRDGAGAATTYRYDNCALLLLFTADARGELRLQEAHASARRASEATPSLEQCATEAAARR